MQTTITAQRIIFLLASLALISSVFQVNAGHLGSTTQDSKEEISRGVEYVIKGNRSVISGPYHYRRITAFVEPEMFTFANVRSMFTYLSEKYPAEDLLWIVAVSDSQQVLQETEWFDLVETFPFGDVAPRECGIGPEPAALSARFTRGMAAEDMVYGSATGEIQQLGKYFDCDESDGEQMDLDYAALLGCKDIVKQRLESGVDPNVRNRHGGVPVFEAAYRGQIEMVRLLLDNGANVNQPSSSGWTALIASMCRDNPDLVELLLSRGADVNVRTQEGRTALTYAVWQRNERVATKLLERGADPNACDGYGKTPLSIATEMHDEKMLRVLTRSPRIGRRLENPQR